MFYFIVAVAVILWALVCIPIRKAKLHIALELLLIFFAFIVIAAAAWVLLLGIAFSLSSG
ncbi:hypothetical protein [Spartinivicinus poritis]|uniref:NADH dehydrogenase subunit 4L n=1 Tax=Spartinivicinus poritis TaxID=2994640 RepID=A0ABT5UFL2_9GAMM|nr:hypothetical protein [Spartinivicinus sp. A2-2]MDE1464776.1 hypothetical protein [Spartinivicinus sp. A2-2]